MSTPLVRVHSTITFLTVDPGGELHGKDPETVDVLMVSGGENLL